MNAYSRQQIARRSELATQRVNKRWQRVRADQRALDAAIERDPLRQPFAIRRRIVIIEADGVTAHEIVRLECDSERSWRRKLAQHGLTTSARKTSAANVRNQQGSGRSPSIDT